MANCENTGLTGKLSKPSKSLRAGICSSGCRSGCWRVPLVPAGDWECVLLVLPCCSPNLHSL